MKKIPAFLFLLFLCLALASCNSAAETTSETDPILQFETYTPPPQEEPSPLIGLLDEENHPSYMPVDQDLARPDEELTRAETASILYTLLTVKPTLSNKAHFQDIAEEAWYREAAESLAELEALDPLGTLFAGETPVTRGEFTWLLAQFFPMESEGANFVDVDPEYWAYAAVESGSAQGWFIGGDGSEFRPDDIITRAEAAVIINRALGRQPDLQTLNSAQHLMIFTDLPTIHWGYADFMEACLNHEHTEEGRWQPYQIPEAQRAPGYYLIDGELYCVQNNGCYARNAQIGRLQFDDNGRYTTGDSELDDRLTKLIREKTVPEWPLDLNLRIVYNYVCNNFDYVPAKMIDSDEIDWEAETALEMLTRGKGNCYSYAGLFTVLARKMGYQAWGVTGEFCNSFQEWTTHGWVQVDIDGEILLCDPEIEGVYAPNRDLKWDLYMKPYGETPTTYYLDGEIYGEEPDWF